MLHHDLQGLLLLNCQAINEATAKKIITAMRKAGCSIASPGRNDPVSVLANRNRNWPIGLQRRSQATPRLWFRTGALWSPAGEAREKQKQKWWVIGSGSHSNPYPSQTNGINNPPPAPDMTANNASTGVDQGHATKSACPPDPRSSPTRLYPNLCLTR